MSPKLFNVFLGDEPVGAGYASREEAVKAARRIAAEKGSLPFEIRPISHLPRADDADRTARSAPSGRDQG
jgi:hypothetical protein